MNQLPNPEVIYLETRNEKVFTKTYVYMYSSDLSVLFYKRLQPEQINCVPQQSIKKAG